MRQLTRRATLLSLASLPFATGAKAAPIPYRLDAQVSRVGFRFNLSGANQTGSMPVKSAKIMIDPANLSRSTVDVSVDVARTDTRLMFARDAMLGQDVLWAKRYPTIRFVSTRVQLGPGGRISDGARITGNLTLRGVTRPVTFDAGLYRNRGSARSDLSKLFIRLRGAISRSAFGADGYPSLVRDRVELDIKAVIVQS